MGLKARLLEDLKGALKAGEASKVSVLRMLKAEILTKEVSLRAERGRDYELNDDEVQKVLNAYAKQRRQSIDAFRQAGRTDLLEQEEAELALVEDYLPRALTDDELQAVVEEALSETGATEKRDMGAVMKVVMARVQGRADGRKVSTMVGERLK